MSISKSNSILKILARWKAVLNFSSGLLEKISTSQFARAVTPFPNFVTRVTKFGKGVGGSNWRVGQGFMADLVGTYCLPAVVRRGGSPARLWSAGIPYAEIEQEAAERTENGL